MAPPADTILRPLGRTENAMNVMHENGNITNVFSVWINTKTHVPDDTWERSLTLLQKNFPTLRLRVVKEGDKRYFKFMDDPHVDFEAQNMSKLDNWKNVHENLLQVRFDTDNGPLWKVKFLRLPHSTDKNEGDEDMEYGHANILMFVLHHCITDGKSNIIMLTRLVHILNAVISGDTVEENDITTLHPTIEHLLPEESIKFRLKDYLQVGKMIYHNIFPHENLFLKRFPAPQLAEGDMGRMRVITLELSLPETENLLFNCREQGSTVEGMLLSAANIAMSRLINEGATPRSMTFHSTHAVTLRRYVPADLSNTLGCFITVHELALPTPADTSDQFWSLAVRATKEIHAILDNGGLLQEYRTILRLLSDKNVKKIMANKVAENEYETSNIGDYDLVFPAEDKHVKVTKVVSSTAMQDLHTPFVHYLRKFRGRFLYNLDYATNWTSTVNAHKYANMTVQLMKEASRRNMCTLSSVAANLPARSFHGRIGMPSTSRVCGLIRFSRILRYAR